MRKYTLLFLLFVLTTVAFGQKKDKIKGSKIVTTEQRKIDDFESLTVEDNLEVYLERGERAELKIEADENLHDIIALDESDNSLRIYTSKQATNFKKLIVRITYTSDLKSITSKNETTVTAIQEVLLDDFALKANDASKLFMNVNASKFVLQSNDKSKTELNIKSDNTTIELSKNSSLKALITATNLKIDMYQKSDATLEGEATSAVIRLDNNASLTANKLTLKNADVTTESYSNCSVNVSTTVVIDAANKSEIQLVGTPKIEIRKFADEAKLIKKLK
ncbi:GIN domain-containing protein [Flavobacterium sp. ZT3P35]|uniref:GIN domain-containing protein n=2 Tax=unclassified Flavobacterium TaxID=196869 RepID=UPI003AAD5A16